MRTKRQLTTVTRRMRSNVNHCQLKFPAKAKFHVSLTFISSELRWQQMSVVTFVLINEISHITINSHANIEETVSTM